MDSVQLQQYVSYKTLLWSYQVFKLQVDLYTIELRMKLVIAVTAIIFLVGTTALPLSKSRRALFITPDNIRHLADYLDNSVSIYDQYIYFSSGSTYEKLIDIPLLEPGETDSQSSIRLTVAFDPDRVTSDSDIRVGISDGTYYNQFYIFDTGASVACSPYSGSHQSNTVHQNYHTGEATLLFHPFHRYGACSTRHDGGYVNTARFNAQLDITKGLSLQVNRDSSSEQYKIYYFIVEIL